MSVEGKGRGPLKLGPVRLGERGKPKAAEKAPEGKVDGKVGGKPGAKAGGDKAGGTKSRGERSRAEKSRGERSWGGKARGGVSRWNDGQAQELVRELGERGVAADLAFRVYATRLIGGERRLVAQGEDGSTSVKTRIKDVTGESVNVLCIQGRGVDMAEITVAGLPALRLEPLRALDRLQQLAGEDQARIQRRNMLEPEAPEGPPEALMHAFLPQRYIDHCHASAVLALTNQAEGEALCREVFGESLAVVPYARPGFELAKAAKAAFDANPEIEGLILIKHGIVTFGDDARESYERLASLVDLAERRLRKGRRRVFAPVELPRRLAEPAGIAPILRGALALSEGIGDRYRRCVLTFRSSEAIHEFVNGIELSRYVLAGPTTPQNLPFTKPWPVILPAPELGRRAAFASAARRAIEDYAADYRSYFRRHAQRLTSGERLNDPLPRVALVRGLGFFAAGPDAAAAAATADLMEATIDTIAGAESLGRFESLEEEQIFDAEYAQGGARERWETEARPLAGQVAVVTGGAGAIGRATARAFHAQGAEVALVDLDLDGMRSFAQAIRALAIRCDVTDEAALAQAFERVCETFGGLDILVSNAGATWQGRIGEVEEAELRQSFELNFFAHYRAAKAAVGIMLQQGTGGALLFNTSRQAISPSAGAGPYGLPNAATLALVRQFAVDYGVDGIRANAVSAEGVRSGVLTEETIAKRALARGVSTEELLRDNLLHREVHADDVARVFVDLALADKTTAAIVNVDGGNIASALR